MIQRERLKFTNEAEVNSAGEVVVYWMQQAQRVEFNHALEYAVFRANELQKPLVVLFALTPSFPEANFRHYLFLLEGLKEVEISLGLRGIKFVMRLDSPEVAVLKFADMVNAALLICDKGYLNVQRFWRQRVAEGAKVRVVEVESDVVVPVEVVSNKEEYAARTIRPKIHKFLADFLKVLKPLKLENKSLNLNISSEVDLSDPLKFAKSLPIDHSVGLGAFHGGRIQVVNHLKEFLAGSANGYAESRNQPMRQSLSKMSPYLHFGQISALEIALRISEAAKKGQMPKVDAEAYLEELIVRRELSMNFCHFNHRYDQYEKALPNWAKESLAKHASDKRGFIYDFAVFEAGKTHDPIWNACQLEMVKSGKMHGYMRMYWGKKILEWSVTPEEAYATALYLNNKYEYDGRDPNGFTGVAWCFGKHDRPWGPERPIFGLVRYMNDGGIKRKIKDWQDYVQAWA